MNKNHSEIQIPFHGHFLHVICRHPSIARRGSILYLHGSGLVFGTKNDLPVAYQELFLNAGYDLLLFDYPLAPESPLREITEAVHTAISQVLLHPETCGLSTSLPFYLFGRSAGAYLAITQAVRLCRTSEFPHPAGLILFYGYHTFDLPEFKKPSPYFKKFPAVSSDTIDALAGRGFLTDGPLSVRYSIYIYARQTGTWTQFLGTDEEISSSSVSKEDLALLPPGFFTACSGDPDVPFRESKQLAASIAGSRFYPVYGWEHDFDRDISHTGGLSAYRAALAWMDELEQ
ncbi:MAG: alpha/beta hydrolase [Clostridiales bacterium]|nr:alpha/beta hydrolase [Clostridiales bacterium]